MRIQDGWLHRLIAQLPDVAFRYRFTPDPGFDYVSPSAEELTGYPPEQLAVRPDLLELFVTQDEIVATRQPAIPRPGGGPSPVSRLVRKDSTVIAVERWWVPIWDELGNLVAIEGLIRSSSGEPSPQDCPSGSTSSTTAEWTRFADFVQIVAHDVHQSIVTAHVYAGILQRALKLGDLDRASSSTEVIESAIQQLDGMIRDFADSVLTEGSGIRLERQQIDLRGFVDRVVADLSKARGVDWIRLEPGEAPSVDADPRHLARILDNLITNALKYSDPGSPIAVRIETRSSQAILSVSDRGIGVAPADLPHLFQQGFRAQDGARRSSGLGLGLYISRLLVEAHGGRIWAESTPGQGSTFFVELPLTR
jgi:signal transduction histidine kinase